MPDVYIDYIEAGLKNGNVVSLNWDESDITRNEDGFEARYKGVYFGEEYANGRIDDLNGMEITDIGLYSESDGDFHFDIEEMLFEDNEKSLSIFYPEIPKDCSGMDGVETKTLDEHIAALVDQSVDPDRFTDSTNAVLCSDSVNGQEVVCVDLCYDSSEHLPECDVENILQIPVSEDNIRVGHLLLEYLKEKYQIPAREEISDNHLSVDTVKVDLTIQELDMIKKSLDVMGDQMADREGYSAGEEYWDLKEKLSSYKKNVKIDNPRLDALRIYKENEELLNRVAEEKKQNQIESMVSQIKALEPRINELIATGNACLQSDIPLTGQAFGMREAYDTNQFFTNSWSHLVGFVGNPNVKPCVIEYLGINGGGACGIYDFRTDGERVFSVNENNPLDITSPSAGHMARFLKTFDTFESAFYEYVDKTIEKQKKSVDKLIASAQEKSAKQTEAVGREVRKQER